MRGRQALALGAVTLLASSACTLLVSTAGLTGAHDDAGASDGGSDGRGGGGLDGSGPFCKSKSPAPTFCEDFDDGDSKLTKWDDSFLDHGALALADGGSLSPPFALEATVEGFDGGGSHMAGLIKRNFPASPRLDYEVAFRSDTTTAVGPGSLHFEINKPNGYGDVFIFVRDGLFVVNVTILDAAGKSYAGSGNRDTGIAMLAGKWYRLKLHFELGNNPTATLTVDGDQTATISLPSPFVPAPFSVRAGAYYLSDPSGPLRMLVDDVALTLP